MSLDMNSGGKGIEGRTQITRNIAYKPNWNRPKTLLVRFYAILVPGTVVLNGLSRAHDVATEITLWVALHVGKI